LEQTSRAEMRGLHYAPPGAALAVSLLLTVI